MQKDFIEYNALSEEIPIAARSCLRVEYKIRSNRKHWTHKVQ